MNHIDLFSGIGGFALAAHWAGFTTKVFCEKDEFCQKVIGRHWPTIPIVGDIHHFDGTRYRGADLLTGGFPCQPFSCAGKQRGASDDRFLWPEMLRVIREARPAFVLGENVPGIISMALDDVLTDLENEGYATQAFVLPACGVNAPHKRDRVWIVARSDKSGLEGRHSAVMPERTEQQPSRQGYSPKTASNAMAHPEHDGHLAAPRSGEAARMEQHPGRAQEPRGTQQSAGSDPRSAVSNAMADTYRHDEHWRASDVQMGWFQKSGKAENDGFTRRTERQSQSRLGDLAHGLPGRLAGHFDREPEIPRTAIGIPQRAAKLKALDNGIAPQVAYEILRHIGDQL